VPDGPSGSAPRSEEPEADDPALAPSAPQPTVELTDKDSASETKRRRGFFDELPILVVLALLVAILIKTFLVQAFYIPSPSMVPTLEHGDRILVCRICTRVGGIHRGDVVVFSSPHPTSGPSRGILGGAVHWLGQTLGVAQPESPDYVKRIIGLPGDVIELKDGQLYRNGVAVAEPYLDPNKDTRAFGPVKVPAGMLFMLGDNRLQSGDSRFPPPNGLGWVPQDKVIGRAFVRVWPPSRWGWVH
jgi:signal peptidase I